MKDEKETKQKLLDCARKEFMEKGYMSASLRSICKEAGVTTGALYFFFKDKEDLFAALVEEPINRLYEVMMQHYQSEACMYEDNVDLNDSDDVEAAEKILHYMYQYYDECTLAITKSQGSRFAGCVDQFVELTEKHYRGLADRICEKLDQPKIEDYMLHWIAHMQIDTFIHLITHVDTEEEAIRHMEPTIHYLVGGWKAMFLKKQ